MVDTEHQRQYIRYPLGIEARAIVGNKIAISRCCVSTISHAGAAMNLQIQDALTPGQNIMLGIKIPDRPAAITIIIKVKWFEFLEGDKNFNAAAGGIITQIKDEERQALLDYAYNQLLLTE